MAVTSSETLPPSLSPSEFAAKWTINSQKESSSSQEHFIDLCHMLGVLTPNADVPIRLRIGINAGEPIAEDDDLHGASVVIAKRLESAAPTDGILVSDVVKQMVVGKDFAFTDQGEVDLKGFDEPVRAWTVAWE
ncbi:MAG: adenylate/guanylate cyclase domain-containing protein [Chloroflexi bacterium]|nr:adenylate/guanylate cyclase domain-containing protein [Chloroflexota bacterium]